MPLTEQMPKVPLREIWLAALLIATPTLPEHEPNGVLTETPLIVAAVVDENEALQGRPVAWTDVQVALPENVAWVTVTFPEASVTSTKLEVHGTGTPSTERLVGPVALNVVLTGVA